MIKGKEWLLSRGWNRLGRDMTEGHTIMSSRKKAPRGSLCLPVTEVGDAKWNFQMARSVQRRGDGCAPREEVKV